MHESLASTNLCSDSFFFHECPHRTFFSSVQIGCGVRYTGSESLHSYSDSNLKCFDACFPFVWRQRCTQFSVMIKSIGEMFLCIFGSYLAIFCPFIPVDIPHRIAPKYLKWLSFSIYEKFICLFGISLYWDTILKTCLFKTYLFRLKITKVSTR